MYRTELNKDRNDEETNTIMLWGIKPLNCRGVGGWGVWWGGVVTSLVFPPITKIEKIYKVLTQPFEVYEMLIIRKAQKAFSTQQINNEAINTAVTGTLHK